MERFNPNSQESFSASTEDYEGTPFYPLMQKLPEKLAIAHVVKMDEAGWSDEEIEIALTELVSKRNEIIREGKISDERLEAQLTPEQKQNLFNDIETRVISNRENFLGEGTTAQIKQHEVTLTQNDEETVLPLAIKYVVKPRRGTLRAESEHNVIKEVQQLQAVDKAERKFPNRSRFIRVPHPYLHFSSDKIDSYGMEVVNGYNLLQVAEPGVTPLAFKEALLNSELFHLDQNELDGYVDRFVETMHEHCLHGDMKPRNVMVNEEGVLYLIDFGQSLPVNTLPSGTEDQVQNLMNDEVKHLKSMVHGMIRQVRKEFDV